MEKQVLVLLQQRRFTSWSTPITNNLAKRGGLGASILNARWIRQQSDIRLISAGGMAHLPVVNHCLDLAPMGLLFGVTFFVRFSIAHPKIVDLSAC